MKTLNFISVAIIAASMFIIGAGLSGNLVSTDYKAKNAVLEHEVDSLRSVLQMYRQNEAVHIHEADSLSSLIDSNLHKTKENGEKYEKDLDDLRLMPADSSYRFFTGYIRQFGR
jgi:hypothetical protein